MRYDFMHCIARVFKILIFGCVFDYLNQVQPSTCCLNGLIMAQDKLEWETFVGSLLGSSVLFQSSGHVVVMVLALHTS